MQKSFEISGSIVSVSALGKHKMAVSTTRKHRVAEITSLVAPQQTNALLPTAPSERNRWRDGAAVLAGGK